MTIKRFLAATAAAVVLTIVPATASAHMVTRDAAIKGGIQHPR